MTSDTPTPPPTGTTPSQRTTQLVWPSSTPRFIAEPSSKSSSLQAQSATSKKRRPAVAATPSDPPASATPILDLSVELQLRILSNLPAKQIQKARRLNKHFRDIIDNAEHRTLLVTPGVERSVGKLQNDVDYHINDLKNVDLLECLVRVIYRQGISTSKVYRDELLGCLAGLTTALYLHRYETPEGVLNKRDREQITTLCKRMIRTYLYDVMGYRTALHDWRADLVMSDIGLDVLSQYGINETDLQAWYRRLTNSKRNCFDGPEWSQDQWKEYPDGEEMLTNLTYFKLGPGFVISMNFETPSWRGELATALGVPELPRTVHRNLDVRQAPPFGYCIRPGWSMKQLWEIFEGKFQGNSGGMTNELAKAALLEDVYLFFLSGGNLKLAEPWSY